MSYQKDFINSIAPGAVALQKQYGVLASITIAQAILESGWGKSKLTVDANNLFGIKADSRWNGEVCLMRTAEYRPTGEKYYIDAGFRKYSSLEQSTEDHALFLVNNSRYKKHGFFEAKDYKGQAQALQNAGYATSPIYGQILIQLIEQYELYQYDSIKKEKKYQKYWNEKFQKWWNETSKTKAPIKIDGVNGPETNNAAEMLLKLLKGEY